MNDVIKAGTVIDRPALFEIGCGAELNRAAVHADGYPGRIVAQVFECSGGRPTLRLASLEDDSASHYGFARDPVMLVTRTEEIKISGLSWFAASGLLRLNGGRGLLISVYPGRKLEAVSGGPVELEGKLRAVDGTTFTRLYAPSLEEPALDLISIPEALQSDFAIHPTARVGIVVAGEGRLLIGGTGEYGGEAVELQEGQSYVVPAGSEYCLHTDGKRLTVVEWSPGRAPAPAAAE